MESLSKTTGVVWLESSLEYVLSARSGLLESVMNDTELFDEFP